MEGRKRSKTLYFDPSNPCRKPHAQGSRVMDLEEQGIHDMPIYVGYQPPVIKEPRRSSRHSIPTDFYHDSEKRNVASTQKEAAAAAAASAVEEDGFRQSSRKSVPTDFYVPALFDAIALSTKDSSPKKKKKKQKNVATKKPQKIPKKKTFSLMKHRTTLEEHVIRMERFALEGGKKPAVKIRSAPVKRKQRKVEAARPEAVDSGESDWADAEGDDGFDDDTINTDDEKESTAQVIPACYDTSILKGSNRIAVQPKRKRGRPRKSDQQAGGTDEKESTQEPTEAPTSAMEKFDQTIEQPMRKRDVHLNLTGTTVEFMRRRLRKNPLRHLIILSLMKNSHQNNEQPKRKRGRPRKSDQQAGGTDEKESTQEPTQAPTSAMEKSDQTIEQPKRKSPEKKRGRKPRRVEAPKILSALKDISESKERNGDDPISSLSTATRSFLSTLGITTAHALLSTRTTDISNEYVKWRADKKMNPLKGSGPITTVSAWKGAVRKKEPTQAPAFAVEKSDQTIEQPKRKRDVNVNLTKKMVELMRRSLRKNPLRHLIILSLWRTAIKTMNSQSARGDDHVNLTSKLVELMRRSLRKNPLMHLLPLWRKAIKL